MARGTAKFDADILRRLRASREVGGRLLSAADLALLLKTSKARVLAYEQETSVPEPGRVLQMAKIFKVNPRELYQALPNGHVDQLRDLRCYAGLTASEFATRIGVSRTTYRDIERLAILPARDDGTLPLKMASALGLPLGMIHRALDHHPAAAERRTTIAQLLIDIFARAKVRHHPAVVNPEDKKLLQIAEQLRRPASVVCRLINYDLGRYRDLLRRCEIAEINLAYAQGRRQADIRAKEVEELQRDIDRRPFTVASTQLRFLAEAMSSQQWRFMVELSYRNGRTYDVEVLTDPTMRHIWDGLLGRDFVTLEPGPSGSLTVHGTTFGLTTCRNQRRYYECLYPRISVPAGAFRQNLGARPPRKVEQDRLLFQSKQTEPSARHLREPTTPGGPGSAL